MESETEPSRLALVLLGVATIAVFWMFIWKTKSERRATRLIKWVWENYPDAWASLPWAYRNLLRERGLFELGRRGAIEDPYFDHELREIRPDRRHVLVAGLVAGVCIMILLFGTSYLGWRF